MSTLFISQKGWKGTLRRFVSASLSLLLILQAFGPGFFNIQAAVAAGPDTLFSDSFGIAQSDTVTGWAEHEPIAHPKWAQININDPLLTSSTTGNLQLTEGASTTQSSISTLGYENIKVSYYFRGDVDAEPSDTLKFYAKKSSNVNFGNAKKTHAIGTSTASTTIDWTFVEVSLASFANNSSIDLRFSGNSSHEREQARVDDVVVTGVKIEEVPDPEPEPAQCIPGQELIKNGGFELPIVTNSAQWDIFKSGTPTLEWLVSWMSPNSTRYPDPNTGTWIPDVAKLELQRGVNGWLPEALLGGAQYTELDSDWDGPIGSLTSEPASVKIFQDIPTVPGKNYEVKFSFSPRPGTDASQNMLGVLWNGLAATSTIALDGSANSNTDWRNYSLNFIATTSLSQITFQDLGTPDSLGTFLDNVSVMCLADACRPTSGNIVSDASTTVVDPAGNTPADVLSFIHPAWTADVDGIDTSAKWIWSDDPVTDPATSTTKTFEKKFTVVGTPELAVLDIAADNYYKAWVNGVEVGSELVNGNSFQSNPANYHSIPVGILVNGENTLTIETTNLGVPGSDAAGNPAGLLFKLSWTAKDCGNPPPPPDNVGTSQVIVKKYIDGVPATASSSQSHSFYIEHSTTVGSGEEPLDSNFMWESPELPNFTGIANIKERTASSGTPDPMVLSLGSACESGKFRLNGYSIGTSFVDAEGNATSSGIIINTIQDADVYAIIWNETCPIPPPLPQTGELVVVKEVVGTSTSPLLFSLFVDGMPATTSVATTTTVGLHVVSETPDANYAVTFGGACDGNGNITVVTATTTTCIVTNTWVVDGQGGDQGGDTTNNDGGNRDSSSTSNGSSGGGGGTSSSSGNRTSGGQVLGANTNGSGTSGGGGSSGGPSGEVLGASIELPGLPDTGAGPILKVATTMQIVAIIFLGLATIATVNYVSYKILSVPAKTRRKKSLKISLK